MSSSRPAGEHTRGMTVDRPTHVGRSARAELRSVDARRQRRGVGRRDRGDRLLQPLTAGTRGTTVAAMRATVMRDWQLRVDDLADPTPGAGQVLAKVLACGICGSDLHMLQHGAESRRLMDELTADRPPDPMQMKMFEPELDTVMGHEFCCEVVDLGPELLEPEGRRHRRQPARRVRRRRPARRRVTPTSTTAATPS